MNVFQTCRNTADVVPLYLPQNLYLKPAAKMNVSIQLPNLKKLEKSISHWEIMEKLRTLVRPDEFSVLKVSKSTSEIVRFEAEIENKTRLDRVISKLNNNSIKLKEIQNLIRVKASEAKCQVPTKHQWDAFFQEAKDMDEMKPGQRPDTLHLSKLPIKWFVQYHSRDREDATPSEKILWRIFEKFGPIRYVDIPICDVYRKKMKEHISGIKEHAFDDKDFFEGYVQFKDYIGFSAAMSALRGMKLLKKEDDEAFSTDISVDFDRSKHLSEASIRRREIVRDRLVKKHHAKEEREKQELDKKKQKEQDKRKNQVNSKADKERRRKEREEKRKKKLLEKLKLTDCDELNEKIAKEEKKLLKAQRKLEAIRLVEELFKRIKEKRQDEIEIYSHSRKSGADELKRYKNLSELAVLTQRQKLHNAIEGRVVLKSILADKKSGRKLQESSSSDSDSSVSKSKNLKSKINVPSEVVYDGGWFPFAYPTQIYSAPMAQGALSIYPGGHPPMRGPVPGSSRARPYYRGRGHRGGRFRPNFRSDYSYEQYHPELQKQYSKYFSKFLPHHDNRSRSYSRSRSYTRSRTRSRSRSRSRRRSYSRYSNSRSRSRDRRSRSRSKRSRDARARSKSHYTPPSGREKKTPEKTRSLSVDSSKFKSPRSVRRPRSRSRSWSMPRNSGKEKSWSKSPEKENNKK